MRSPGRGHVGPQRHVAEPLTIALISSGCTLAAAWGGHWIAGRRERRKIHREYLSADIGSFLKEVDSFSEKCSEWWLLAANDQTLTQRRLYIVSRSARLGKDLQRLIRINRAFSQASPFLARLRDAAELGEFYNDARPPEPARAQQILQRANALRDKVKSIFDQRYR